MANFIDPQTGETFTIPHHKIVFKNGKWENVSKSNGEILTNPSTGNKLVSIPKEGIPQLLKSNDKATRISMLKQRSKDHFKKEIKEQKYEMNKELIRKFES